MLENHFAGRSASLAAMVGLLLLALANPAEAAWDWATGPSIYDEEGKRSWGVEFVPYLWLANLSGQLSLPRTPTIPVNPSFSDLSSNLNSGFAGVIDLRYRRWHLISDNSWVSLKVSEDVVAGPADFNATLEPAVAFGTVALAYEIPLVKSFSLETYLAARWWHVTVDSRLMGDVTSPGPGGAVIPFDGSQSITQSWANAIVGARARYQISDRWRVSAAADIGGGNADLDWSFLASVGFDINRYLGLTLGWRILGVDYSNQGFVYDITQSGMLLGLNLRY